MNKKKISVFNWSGGKDSAMALYRILQDNTFDVRYLLTSLGEDTQRVSMHGLRKTLLYEQIKSIGIPLKELLLPTNNSMQNYETHLFNLMETLRKDDIEYSIFGDIFLEDLRRYREQQLQKVAMKALFPLWKENTTVLLKQFLELGFKTIVTAVDASKLDASFAGRVIDNDFIKDLPSGVDPCGENGEFHTFVFDGPIFKTPIRFKKGEIIKKEYSLGTCDDFKDTNTVKQKTYSFFFCDLIPFDYA